MQEMPRSVSMTRTRELRSRMTGKLSCPVLKAGRKEQSFLPSDQIAVEQADHKHDWRGHRSINGQIGLRVPKRVIQAKCRPYLQRGKPIHRRERIDDSVYTIIAQFQQEYRGLVGQAAIKLLIETAAPEPASRRSLARSRRW